MRPSRGVPAGTMGDEVPRTGEALSGAASANKRPNKKSAECLEDINHLLGSISCISKTATPAGGTAHCDQVPLVRMVVLLVLFVLVAVLVLGLLGFRVLDPALAVRVGFGFCMLKAGCCRLASATPMLR